MRRVVIALISACCFQFLPAQEAGEVKCSDEAAYTVEGTLTSDNDKFPVMATDGDHDLHVGDKGEMHKYFETPFLRSKITGWMSIGIVHVTAVKGHNVTFKVLDETAE